MFSAGIMLLADDLSTLWFLYHDGALWCASRPRARVVRHLERDGLGTRDSLLARRLLASAADEVTIRIVPARLASWDYTERMRTV